MAQEIKNHENVDNSWESYLKKADIVLLDADDNCNHHIVDAPGGGIKCTECSGWFCY